MGRPCFREGVVARRKRGGMRRTSNNKSINKYKQLKRIKIKKDFKDTDILGSRSETAVKKIKVLSETYDPSTSKIFDYEFDDDYFADSGENMGVEDEVSTKSATKTTVGKKSKKKKVKVEEPTDDENTESGQLFSNIDSLPSEGSEVTKSRNDFGGNVRDDFKDLVPGLGSRKASAIDFSGDATVDFYENIMKNLQDFSGSVVDDFAEQIKQDEALSLTRADFNGDVAVDFGRLAVYSFSKKVEVPMADFSGNVSEDFRELIHYCDDEVTFSLTDGGFGPCGIGKFSAVVERDFKDLLRLYKNFRAAKMCSQDADTKEGKSFECRQDSGILACSRELSGCKRRTVHESFDHGTGKDFRVSFSKPHKLNSSELYSVFSAAKFASEAGLKVPGVDTEGFVDDKFVEFLQEENKHTDVRHVINECAMNRPEFKDTETFHNYLELYKSYYQSQTLYNFDLEEKDDNAFALVEQQFKQYLRLVNMFTVAKMYSESGRHVPGIDSNGFVDERFVDYLNKIFNVNVRKVINDSAMLTAGPEIRGEETNYYKEYLYFYSKAIPDPDIGLTCQDYGSSSHLANTPSCVGGCQEKGSCCRFPDALNKAKSCEAPSCNIVMSHPVARDCTTSIRELSCGRQYESACNATRKSCGRWDQCVHTCRTGCFQDENDKKCSDDIKYIYVEPRKRRSVELDDTPDVDDALVVWADVGSGVEQTRNHHSGESAARYVKEPRLSQHSTQLRMGRKDGGKTKKSRKLSFTDEIFKNASVESLEEKINDENGRATEKDSAMYCVVKNGDTKSGRHQNGGNIPKLRKLRFLRDLDDDLGDDDMFNNSRSHRSAERPTKKVDPKSSTSSLAKEATKKHVGTKEKNNKKEKSGSDVSLSDGKSSKHHNSSRKSSAKDEGTSRKGNLMKGEHSSSRTSINEDDVASRKKKRKSFKKSEQEDNSEGLPTEDNGSRRGSGKGPKKTSSKHEEDSKKHRKSKEITSRNSSSKVEDINPKDLIQADAAPKDPEPALVKEGTSSRKDSLKNVSTGSRKSSLRDADANFEEPSQSVEVIGSRRASLKDTSSGTRKSISGNQESSSRHRNKGNDDKFARNSLSKDEVVSQVSQKDDDEILLSEQGDATNEIGSPRNSSSRSTAAARPSVVNEGTDSRKGSARIEDIGSRKASLKDEDPSSRKTIVINEDEIYSVSKVRIEESFSPKPNLKDDDTIKAGQVDQGLIFKNSILKDEEAETKSMHVSWGVPSQESFVELQNFEPVPEALVKRTVIEFFRVLPKSVSKDVGGFVTGVAAFGSHLLDAHGDKDTVTLPTESDDKEPNGVQKSSSKRSKDWKLELSSRKSNEWAPEMPPKTPNEMDQDMVPKRTSEGGHDNSSKRPSTLGPEMSSKRSNEWWPETSSRRQSELGPEMPLRRSGEWGPETSSKRQSELGPEMSPRRPGDWEPETSSKRHSEMGQDMSSRRPSEWGPETSSNRQSEMGLDYSSRRPSEWGPETSSKRQIELGPEMPLRRSSDWVPETSSKRQTEWGPVMPSKASFDNSPTRPSEWVPEVSSKRHGEYRSEAPPKRTCDSEPESSLKEPCEWEQESNMKKPNDRGSDDLSNRPNECAQEKSSKRHMECGANISSKCHHECATETMPPKLSESYSRRTKNMTADKGSKKRPQADKHGSDCCNECPSRPPDYSVEGVPSIGQLNLSLYLGDTRKTSINDCIGTGNRECGKPMRLYDRALPKITLAACAVPPCVVKLASTRATNTEDEEFERVRFIDDNSRNSKKGTLKCTRSDGSPPNTNGDNPRSSKSKEVTEEINESNTDSEVAPSELSRSENSAFDPSNGHKKMIQESHSSNESGSQKRHARLSRSASERTDKASKGFATGSRHVDESVEDSTLSMSKDSESSSEEEPARKSRPSKRTARAASDRALRRRSGSSSPSRGADESEESYSNREEVVSEDDTAHAKKVTLQSRKASQQMQSLRAQSSTHLQKNNYDSNEEYFTEDELRQELAECRRQLRSQSYDPAMSRTVNPVGSTRRPESDSEDERARGSCYNGRCSRRPTGFNYSFVPPTQGNYDNQTNYQRKSRKENLFAYNEPPKQKLKGFPPETTFRCYVERNPIQGGPVYLHGAPIFECQPDDARCQASLGNSEAIYHCTLDHSVPAVQPGPLYDNHQYQTLGQQSQMMYMPDPQADYGRRMHGEAGGGNYAGNSTTGCNFTSNGSPVGGGSPGSNVEKVVPSCAPTGCNFLRTSSPGGSGNITSSGSPVGSANFLPFGSAKSTSNFQPTGSPVNNGSSGGGNFLPFVPAVSTSNFGSPGSPVENFVPAGTNAVGYNFGPNRECVSCSNFGPNREGAVNGNYEPNRECYSCVNFPQNREFPAGGGFAQNQVYPASFNGGQNREYPASGSCGSNRDCGVGENFETNRESGVGGGYGQNMESYCCGNYAAMGSSPAPRHYQCGQYDTQSCCCGGMQRSPLLSARPSQQVTTQCTQNPMARTESWSQRSQDYGNNSQNYLQKYSYGASRTASNNPPPVYTPPAILSIPPNASTGKYEPVDDNQQ